MPPFKAGSSLAYSVILTLLVTVPLTCVAYQAQKGTTEGVALFHHIVPLGTLTYTLRPANRPFYLMASAIDPQFEGWKVLGSEFHQYVIDAAGERVKSYPSQILFRVSAGAKDSTLLDTHREPVAATGNMNSYLLNLSFRLKIFRGLSARTLHPSMVRMIGVPADVPYEERIYQVSFETKDVPLEDRMVLEVLSPGGQRLGKFHLDFY